MVVASRAQGLEEHAGKDREYLLHTQTVLDGERAGDGGSMNTEGVKDLEIRLAKGAVIDGTLTDDRGEPSGGGGWLYAFDGDTLVNGVSVGDVDVVVVNTQLWASRLIR